MDILEKAKARWVIAGNFPTNKEEVYPEHGIAQGFDEHTGKHVLEYGCGGGSDAISYLRRGNSVVAVDIVPENIERAKQNVQFFNLMRKAGFVKLDNSSPLPFEANTFDLVNSHGVLHHIPDPEDVVREFYRVLKPGGLIYIMLYTEYLWDHFKDQVPAVMRQNNISEEEAFCWLVDGGNTPYATYYHENVGCYLLEQAGFEIIRTYDYHNDWFRNYKAVKK